MSSLFARTSRGITLAHVRRVAIVPPRRASEPVARVYRQVEADFGILAPPVALHAPAPAVLAASWAMLRETLLVRAEVDRTVKEVVAAAVSTANRCPYCVDVHASTVAGLMRGRRNGAVTAGRFDELPDPRLRSIARWAAGSGSGAGAQRVLDPFPPAHAPELIGVAVVFHYFNRMVNVFLRDSPLPAVPVRLRELAGAVATRMMGRLARNGPPAGASLALLPAARPAADLNWARGQPHIVDAMARATAAIEEAGRRTVPEHVRQLVDAALVEGPPPLGAGGRWLADRTAVAAADRPVARLALLTAVASYRVTGAMVEDVRRAGNDDAAVIEIAAWSSLCAARRVGGLLAGAFEPSALSQEPDRRGRSRRTEETTCLP